MSGSFAGEPAGTPLGDALREQAEDLYEDAPCGYLSTLPDGTIVRVNRTFLAWTGYTAEELLDGRRFADLLTAGGRIYHETHYAPLLAMQGTVREIAVELRRADGSRLPVLLNAVLKRDDDGQPLMIRTTIFDATDRRRYEQELVLARDREREMREHAERLEREAAEVAAILQQSMLASVPLDEPRVAIGAHYRPAVEALEVGGDWHDAFPVEGGRRVGMVVGDVVGRGIQAAAAMGQLRSATRALAGAGLGGPSEVLARLDEFATGVPLALLATLVYADLDLESGVVRYACAGHPPPILVAPGATPEVLWEGRSLPLGFAPDVPRAVSGRLTLAPGARLLLYTDGLVERRGEPLDRGIDRLAVEISEWRLEPPQPFVDGLVGALAPGDVNPDDVCALCVQFGRA